MKRTPLTSRLAHLTRRALDAETKVAALTAQRHELVAALEACLSCRDQPGMISAHDRARAALARVKEGR